MVDEGTIRRRFRLIERHLDERMRRLVAAAQADQVALGGASVVARATGVSRRAIRIGAKELKEACRSLEPSRRIRRPGGGRKRRGPQDHTLPRDLERLIEPMTRGDPEAPLRWTCKSVRRLSAELKRMGHRASHRMVAEMLHQLGYSLQANAKTIEGASHGSERAVRAHQPESPTVSEKGRSGHLRGHQEEGVGGRIQKWRPGAAPERSAGEGTGSRLCDSGIGAGHSLWSVRPGDEYGLGERRHRPRYAGVCGGNDSSVVEVDGAKTLSRGTATIDYRRCGRQQWIPATLVEDGDTEAGRRNADSHFDLSLPS